MYSQSISKAYVIQWLALTPSSAFPQLLEPRVRSHIPARMSAFLFISFSSLQDFKNDLGRLELKLHEVHVAVKVFEAEAQQRLRRT